MKKSSMPPLNYRVVEEGEEQPHKSLNSNLGDNRSHDRENKHVEMTLRSHVEDGRPVKSQVRDKKLAVDEKKVESRSEDIDECAEAFIRRFRQQLQIQRLESIENYKQMLARGL